MDMMHSRTDTNEWEEGENRGRKDGKEERGKEENVWWAWLVWIVDAKCSQFERDTNRKEDCIHRDNDASLSMNIPYPIGEGDSKYKPSNEGWLLAVYLFNAPCGPLSNWEWWEDGEITPWNQSILSPFLSLLPSKLFPLSRRGEMDDINRKNPNSFHSAWVFHYDITHSLSPTHSFTSSITIYRLVNVQSVSLFERISVPYILITFPRVLIGL